MAEYEQKQQATSSPTTPITINDDSDSKAGYSHRRRILGITLPTYFDKNAEATLKRKLDFILLSYTGLSIFIKNLDNTNISNAYVSGMQTDLHLYGNQLNYFTTMFNCGIILGAVPLILLSTHIRPSILMPACELCWSVFVMGIAGAKNYETIYGLRFFIGFFAAIAFPGFAALLAAWYTPAELGKRMALYEVSENIAGMFSGYIQSGLYAHMNGRGGMASWRWLFIFDGLISLPIAIWGFYAIPDQPRDTRAKWLKKEERTLAIDRMDRIGRKPVKKINWVRFKRLFQTWHMYLFVACYVFYGAFSWGDGYFGLWLQYLNYNVEDVNNIPTAGQGAAVVNSILSGFISDWLENRPLVIVFDMMICLLGNAFLAVWTAPTALKFVGYIFITTGLPAQSLTMTWLAEVCQGNAMMRGMIVAIGNTFIYAITAWALVLLFPAEDAPHYKYGYQICAGFIGLGVVSVFVILWAIWRDIKRGRAWKNELGLLEYERWVREDAEDGDEALPTHTIPSTE